jgi:hypothetical protein
LVLFFIFIFIFWHNATDVEQILPEFGLPVKAGRIQVEFCSNGLLARARLSAAAIKPVECSEAELNICRVSAEPR